MTKELQKEILAKVKPGTKPSDLKKQTKNSQIPTPPDSPIIVPVDKKPKPKQGPTPIIESKQIKQPARAS